MTTSTTERSQNEHGGGIARSIRLTGPVHVVIPTDRIIRELEGAIVAELRRRGLPVHVHHDAAAAMLDGELLVLTSECRKVPGLLSMLRDAGARRPTTLTWQVEPLPPPGLSDLGERVGRRVMRWSWANLPPVPRRLLEPVVPCRTRIIDGLRWMSARPYARELARAGDGDQWGGFSSRNLHYTMAQYAWLADAVAAGVVDHVAVSTGPRARFLRERGIDASLVPVGYHPDAWGRDLGVERDVDVLFFGVMRKTRRRDVVTRVRDALARRGRSLTIVEHGLFGSDRERLLSRTRVVLNPVKFPWDYPGMRLLMALGCGALVVSEHCDDTAPYEAGRHFVTAAPDALADTILHFLEHEDERAAIAEAGRRFVTEELTIDRTVDALVEAAGFRTEGGEAS